MDGLGSANYAVVDDTHRLWTTGSITSMPTITVGSLSMSAGSESYIKGGSILAMGQSGGTLYPILTDTDGILQTSASVTTGSESYIPAGSVIVTNQVGGSIVSMPTTIVTATDLDIRDLTSASDSIGVSGEYFQDILGSVYVSNQISEITVGSETWIKGGSIHLYSGTSYIDVPNRVAGSIVNLPGVIGVSGAYFQKILGSVQVNAGSVAITNLVDPGSVYITNFDSVGGYAGSNIWIKGGSLEGVSQIAGSIWSIPDVSVTIGSEQWIRGGSILTYSGTNYVDVVNTVQIAGSIWSIPDISVIAGSNVWIKGGSILTYSGTNYVDIPNRVAGSIVNLPEVVGVSGAYFQDILGSVYISNADEISVSVGSESWIKGGSIHLYSGTSYVDVANTVQIAGSIWSMPDVSVTAGSNVWIKGGSIQTYSSLGSTFVLGSVYATGSINLANDLASIGSWTGYVGSIWSIPDIQTSLTGSLEVFSETGSVEVYGNLSASAGSEVWIRGGSLEGTSQIAGSIWSMPDVNVSAGSEVWVKAGSIQTYTPLGSTFVLGSIYTTGSVNIATTVLPVSGTLFQNILGSVQVNTGSVRAQVVQITDPWQIAGSIWSMPDVSVEVGSEVWVKAGSIQTYTPLGSTFVLGSVYTTGSVNIATSLSTIGSYTRYIGSETWIKAGSVQTYTPLGSTFVLGSVYTTGSVVISSSERLGGSIVNMPNIVGVSGDYFQDMIGSVRAQSIQVTTPWQIAGSIWSVPSTVVTATNLDIRDLTKASDNVATSGTATVAGSVYTTGSINIATSLASIGSFTGMTNGSVWWGGGVGSVVISGVPAKWSGVGSVVISGTSIPVWKGVGSVYTTGSVNISTNLASIGSFTGMANKTLKTYTGSLIVSGGNPQVYIGSHIVALNNEVNWISVIGSIGSTYNFEVKDSENYQILSNLPRSGKLSYMTPFLASGNIVFIISGAQVSGNYPLRLGYT